MASTVRPVLVGVVDGDLDGASHRLIPKAEGLPVGNYLVVACGMDVTGRHLDDEILQIAAWTPEKDFSIYAMPKRNLNHFARRLHKVRIVTSGRDRVLMGVEDDKRINTESEESVLRNFIAWLEEVKGDAEDGVILVYHGPMNSCPAMLLHRLGRYSQGNLLDRFKAVVAGFANGFAVAQSKCDKTVTCYDLKTLYSTLLGKEESQESAVGRSSQAYQVLQKLCSEDGADNIGAGDGAAPNTASMISCVREYTQPCRREEALLLQRKDVIKCQDALRPVFRHLMKGRKNRKHYHLLRKKLVDARVDMIAITKAWNAGRKDRVGKILEEKAHISDEKDKTDLLTQIEWHFVPELRPEVDRRPSFKK